MAQNKSPLFLSFKKFGFLREVYGLLFRPQIPNTTLVFLQLHIISLVVDSSCVSTAVDMNHQQSFFLKYGFYLFPNKAHIGWGNFSRSLISFFEKPFLAGGF